MATGNAFFRSRFLPHSTQIHEMLRSQPPEILLPTFSTLSEELTRYNEEISRLRALLETLESDREALQSCYDAWRSLLAPVRRVPTEILVDIFARTRPKRLNDWWTPKSVKSHIAETHLLAVSQVCRRWYNIVLDTPTLWDTIHLNGRVWTHEMIPFLTLILERSQKSLLNVSISHNAGCEPIRRLLASHSERWQTVYIDFDFRDFPAAQGQVPSLETLELHNFNGPTDFFQVAPRLRNLTISGGIPPIIDTLPLSQLHTFACVWLSPLGAEEVISLMPCLSPATKFRLGIDISDYASEIVDFELPPTTSNIIGFTLDTVAVDQSETQLFVQLLTTIFKNLTLPNLHQLAFKSRTYPFGPMFFPHSEFISFSTRSSFYGHLKSLQLAHVVISEVDLLECLSALPLLQRLEIADHQLIGEEGADQHLVSDTLLSSLSRTVDLSSLLPDLRFLSCWSLLKFNDSVYLGFVLSRVQDEASFEAELRWLQGHHRELDPAAVGHLQELCAQRKLVFSFAEVTTEN
ncbi:hypothetical protein K438DRAFT_1930197 [Mycena galopus ATCC 62051]|nr:hypothetical protein K438DRAFT_1930197 [Mycena galopus ATCC 62051]